MAHWAPAGRGPRPAEEAEDVHTGAPQTVNELAVAALIHVKHTVGKLFHTERRRQHGRISLTCKHGPVSLNELQNGSGLASHHAHVNRV